MTFDTEYYMQIVRAYLKRSEPTGSTITISETCEIDQLGTYICALANLAAYKKIPYTYAIWGIDQDTREISGTSFIPPSAEQLALNLPIKAVYSILKIAIEDVPIVMLEVQCPSNTTMQYKGTEYIFIKDQLKELSSVPDVEKEIWANLEDHVPFESQIAKSNVSAEEILKLLDCELLFKLLAIPYRNNPTEIISKLIELRFITEKNTGKYSITNLGALLLAKRLKYFETVEYKAVRVLQYDGVDVTTPAKEQIGGKGYIVGFEGLIKYIVDCLPTREVIDGALRKKVSKYPSLAIRELVANALIHQDLGERGAPIVSIFPDHIEITNPGKPLIQFDRFIDHPPCSRNESLVAAMRKVGICEERGSGYDKIISDIEKYNMPAPTITEYERSIKVSLYVRKDFSSLTKKERIDACYSHVCLNYVRNEVSNNATLRSRFGLEESERYKISRVFNETCDAGLIKPRDGTGMKNREYVPYWSVDLSK